MSNETKENESDNCDQAVKSVIFDALRAAHISEVRVEFDGDSDDGQFGEITAFRDGTSVDCRELSVIFPDDDGECELKGRIETMCCDLLDGTHEGWEINEGSYGEFRFDVVSGTITLEFSGRYVEVEAETHTF